MSQRVEVSRHGHMLIIETHGEKIRRVARSGRSVAIKGTLCDPLEFWYI